jgi:hypothetical protein
MPAPVLGLIRIRDSNKKTVFEFRDVQRSDADEIIAGHIAQWRFEGKRVGKTWVKQKRDFSGLKVEWIENEGEPNETVTPIPVNLPKSNNPTVK